MNCLDCGGSECICTLLDDRRVLSKACQIFTQALGDEEGYIPAIGAPKTREALALMAKAKVAPVFHGEPTRTNFRPTSVSREPVTNPTTSDDPGLNASNDSMA